MKAKLTKRCLSLLLTLAMLCGLWVPTAAATGSTYSDTQGHWAESSIERWSDYGIIQGNNGKFNPSGSLTRAHMAAILSRLLKLPEAADAGFKDVNGEWFADSINRCAAAGIMLGNNGYANPNATITRQQAVVMLGRALGIQPIENADLSQYTDAAQVSAYAVGYIAAMAEAGIVKGTSATTLSPVATINRAATVTILDRAIEVYANEAGASVKAAGTGLVLVVADGVKVTAPEGTTVVIPAQVKDTTVNGVKVSGGQAYEAVAEEKEEEKKPAGGGGGGGGSYTPPAVVEHITVDTSKTVSGEDYKNVTIGNVTITDAVGDGEVTLTDMTITGTLTINGGGSNSIRLVRCRIHNPIVMNKTGGQAPRLHLTETNVSKVEAKQPAIIESADGSSVTNLTAKADVTIQGTQTNVQNVTVPADAAAPIVSVDDGAKVHTVVVQSPATVAAEADATVKNVTAQDDVKIASGSVGTVTVPATAENVEVQVQSGAALDQLNAQGSTSVAADGAVNQVTARNDVTVSSGSVGTVTVPANAGDVNVTVDADASVEDVTINQAAGTTITNNGEVGGVSSDLADAPEIKKEGTNAAEIPVHFHKWNDGEITKAATCTTDGVLTYTCKAEGCESTPATKTHVILASGHNWSTTWTEKDAGSHERICLNDETHKDVVDHTWNAGKVTKAATCTTDGEKVYTCTGCKATKTEVLTALGHDFDTDGKYDGKNADGHWYVCNRKCGEKNILKHTVVIDKAVAATCTTTGLTEGSHCSDCAYVIAAQTVTEKLGHDFTGEYSKDETGHWHVCLREGCDETDTKAAHTFDTTNCAEKATCTVCKYEKAAGNHTWNNGVVTKAATCKDDGVKTYTCSSCRDTKTETIPALGHDFDTDGKFDGSDASGHWYVCNRGCGEKNVLNHTVVIDKAVDATCEETGLTEGSHCSDCDYVIVMQTEVPALKHDWSDWQEYDEKTHQRTCSNDSTHFEAAEHSYTDDTDYICNDCGYKRTLTGINALIAEAESMGLLNYLDKTTFVSGGKITRLQASMLAAAMMGLTPDSNAATGTNGKTWPFTDGANLTDDQKALITALTLEGVMSGYEDGSFRPDEYITNAAIVKLIDVALDQPVVPITKTNNIDTTHWVYIPYAMLDNLGILDNVDISVNASAVADDVLTIFIDARVWRNNNPKNPQYPVSGVALADGPLSVNWNAPTTAGLNYKYEMTAVANSGNRMTFGAGSDTMVPLFGLNGETYTSIEVDTYVDGRLCGTFSAPMNIQVSETVTFDAKPTFTENTDGTVTLSITGLTPGVFWHMYLGKEILDFGMGIGSNAGTDGTYSTVLSANASNIVKNGGYYLLREYPTIKLGTDGKTLTMSIVDCDAWTQCTVTGGSTTTTDYKVSNIRFEDQYLMWSLPTGVTAAMNPDYEVTLYSNGDAVEGCGTNHLDVAMISFAPGTYDKVEIRTIIDGVEMACAEQNISLTITQANDEPAPDKVVFDKLTDSAGDVYGYQMTVTGLMSNRPYVFRVMNKTSNWNQATFHDVVSDANGKATTTFHDVDLVEDGYYQIIEQTSNVISNSTTAKVSFAYLGDVEKCIPEYSNSVWFKENGSGGLFLYWDYAELTDANNYSEYRVDFYENTRGWESMDWQPIGSTYASVNNPNSRPGTYSKVRVVAVDENDTLADAVWFEQAINLTIAAGIDAPTATITKETTGEYTFAISNLYGQPDSRYELMSSLDANGKGHRYGESSCTDGYGMAAVTVDWPCVADGYYRLREYVDVKVSNDLTASFIIREKEWAKCFESAENTAFVIGTDVPADGTTFGGDVVITGSDGIIEFIDCAFNGKLINRGGEGAVVKLINCTFGTNAECIIDSDLNNPGFETSVTKFMIFGAVVPDVTVTHDGAVVALPDQTIILNGEQYPCSAAEYYMVDGEDDLVDYDHAVHGAYADVHNVCIWQGDSDATAQKIHLAIHEHEYDGFGECACGAVYLEYPIYIYGVRENVATELFVTENGATLAFPFTDEEGVLMDPHNSGNEETREILKDKWTYGGYLLWAEKGGSVNYYDDGNAIDTLDSNVAAWLREQIAAEAELYLDVDAPGEWNYPVFIKGVVQDANVYVTLNADGAAIAPFTSEDGTLMNPHDSPNTEIADQLTNWTYNGYKVWYELNGETVLYKNGEGQYVLDEGLTAWFEEAMKQGAELKMDVAALGEWDSGSGGDDPEQTHTFEIGTDVPADGTTFNGDVVITGSDGIIEFIDCVFNGKLINRGGEGAVAKLINCTFGTDAECIIESNLDDPGFETAVTKFMIFGAEMPDVTVTKDGAVVALPDQTIILNGEQYPCSAAEYYMVDGEDDLVDYDHATHGAYADVHNVCIWQGDSDAAAQKIHLAIHEHSYGDDTVCDKCGAGGTVSAPKGILSMEQTGFSIKIGMDAPDDMSNIDYFSLSFYDADQEAASKMTGITCSKDQPYFYVAKDKFNPAYTYDTVEIVAHALDGYEDAVWTDTVSVAQTDAKLTVSAAYDPSNEPDPMLTLTFDKAAHGFYHIGIYNNGTLIENGSSYSGTADSGLTTGRSCIAAEQAAIEAGTATVKLNGWNVSQLEEVSGVWTIAISTYAGETAIQAPETGTEPIFGTPVLKTDGTFMWLELTVQNVEDPADLELWVQNVLASNGTINNSYMTQSSLGTQWSLEGNILKIYRVGYIMVTNSNLLVHVAVKDPATGVMSAYSTNALTAGTTTTENVAVTAVKAYPVTEEDNYTITCTRNDSSSFGKGHYYANCPSTMDYTYLIYMKDASTTLVAEDSDCEILAATKATVKKVAPVTNDAGNIVVNLMAYNPYTFSDVVQADISSSEGSGTVSAARGIPVSLTMTLPAGVTLNTATPTITSRMYNTVISDVAVNGNVITFKATFNNLYTTQDTIFYLDVADADLDYPICTKTLNVKYVEMLNITAQATVTELTVYFGEAVTFYTKDGKAIAATDTATIAQQVAEKLVLYKDGKDMGLTFDAGYTNGTTNYMFVIEGTGAVNDPNAVYTFGMKDGMYFRSTSKPDKGYIGNPSVRYLGPQSNGSCRVNLSTGIMTLRVDAQDRVAETLPAFDFAKTSISCAPSGYWSREEYQTDLVGRYTKTDSTAPTEKGTYTIGKWVSGKYNSGGYVYERRFWDLSIMLTDADLALFKSVVDNYNGTYQLGMVMHEGWMTGAAKESLSSGLTMMKKLTLKNETGGSVAYDYSSSNHSASGSVWSNGTNELNMYFMAKTINLSYAGKNITVDVPADGILTITEAMFTA